MPTIPKLNLAKELTPEQITSILNRWADHVTTALNEVDNHTKSTNQLTLAQRDFITKVPLVTVDTGSGDMQQQPITSPSPRKPPLPGPPKRVGQDNLLDGDGNGGGRFRRVDNVTGGNRVSIASLLGDTSGDTATDLVDTNTLTFNHGRMSLGTQAVATSGGSIQNTAPVVGHPSANIGVALQKLNASGLLLDVDQIAAQGSVHKVVSAIDTNERALIDFAQTGHIGTLSNYREMVSAATPAIYLKFDETSGTTAFDASGHGLNGTYNGGFSLQQGAAIAGEVSSSVKGFSAGFNGSTGFVSVPFNSSLNPSTFSVSMWVNLSDSAPAGSYCLASAFVVNVAKGWALYQLSGGTTLAFQVADGTNYNESSASSAIGTGSWHHVCGTYDGTTARLYIDGVLSQSFASGFSANTSGQTLISELNFNGTPSDFFHGFIDEFSVHSGALSAQQIAGLYTAGNIGPHRTVDDVPDGSTYVRIGNVNPDHTFHVSSSLNSQGSLVGSPAAFPSYTSTTTSISWSWGAFTAYFPDGSTLAVSSGSHNFTGLTANTTYYFEFYVVKSTATMTCVMSDNTTAPASVQFLAQTVGADGHLIEVTDITAATPSSGTGGGSGGGGTCFSGDTRIKTDLGFVRMDELPAEFNIVNQTGIHHALRIVHTYRDDQLLVMPDNGLVTAGHMMQKGESWVPASELFSEKAPAGTRTLYDIQVVTGKPEDMHYILENGYVAHNKSRVSCFDGEARVLTTEGWIKFKDLPEKFQIVNSKGTFDGRLFQHQSSRTNPPRMRLLPDGGTVTDDHIVRPLGEADWRHVEELLPASTNFPEVVYNIISDGGYYRVGNLEARALEGND